MMELSLQDVILGVDLNQDFLPPITVGLYGAFLAKGKKGFDALLVYQHLLFTCRLQHSNTIKATNSYIMRGLGMGEHRVKRAKGLLRSMEIIQTIRRKGEKGKIAATFLRLNLVTNPGPSIGAKSDPVVTIGAKSAPMGKTLENVHRGQNPPLWKKTHKMLEERIQIKKEVVSSAPPAEKASKKTARASKPPGEQSRLTDLFFERYKTKTGTAPPWTGKEGKLLREDLARLGAQKMTAAIALFFGKAPSDVKQWAQSKGWDYAVGFHSQLPKIEAALVGESKRLSRVRTCPKCGLPDNSNSSECLSCHTPFQEAHRAAS